MFLLFHIIIASVSLCTTAFLFFAPSLRKMYINYILVFLTIATGTVLVVTQPAHMTQTCMVGLLYIGLVSFGILSARHKLAKVTKE